MTTGICTRDSQCAAAPTPPRAQKHQQAVADVLAMIYSLPQPQFAVMTVGRTLEKLIRSYHYWAAEYGTSGCDPYTRLSLGYFRMTPAACAQGNLSLLHTEHVVPTKRLKLELLALRATSGTITPTQAADIMDLNEIVLVTNHEATLLDKRYRSDMPRSWTRSQSRLARFEQVLNLYDQQLCGTRLIGP